MWITHILDADFHIVLGDFGVNRHFLRNKQGLDLAG